eukprot:Sdes_comp19764_c0_seq1m11810
MAKQTAKELISKKASIEQELLETLKTLDQLGVGLDKPLVDSEGFPLPNLDLYTIRQLRNRAATLQNDHKSILREVETALHQIHMEAKATGQVNSQLSALETDGTLSPSFFFTLFFSSLLAPSSLDYQTADAFAKVGQVSPSSPADQAGVCSGDLIVVFGSLSRENFTNLYQIADLIESNINIPILLKLLRPSPSSVEFHLKRLVLTPRPWSGSGLLGCHVLPS